MSEPIPPPSRARFETAYQGAPPPWEIGRPQPAFVELADAGEIRGEVLDAGCGTGENALLCAARGHRVLGVDAVAQAIEKARAKAAARKLDERARFEVHDALELASLGRTFDTIIDSGLFHVFTDDERLRYVAGLAAALRAGGSYHFEVFSDREPTEWGGPRRVTEAEIRALFLPERGFRVRALRATKFDTNFHQQGGHAWLATIDRV